MADQRLFRRQGGLTEPLPEPSALGVGAEERWRERRLAARLLRAASVVVPVLAGIAVVFGLAGIGSRPAGGERQAAWWLGLALAGAATMWGVERLTRRLRPLAALLGVSLLFPGRAPRRLWVGLGAGKPSTVDARLAALRRHGLSADPSRAATQAIVLLASLGGRRWRTWNHAEQVARYADMVAARLGVDAHGRDRLRWAALLHDIGMLTHDPAMATRAGPLEREQWAVVRNHPSEGADLVGPLRRWLGGWSTAVDQHHERWDGYGYPQGLAGDRIGLGARIVAVADAFEVLTAPWSYRRAMTPAQARTELGGSAGRHFDPEVVRAFVELPIDRFASRAIPYRLRSDSLAPVRRPAAMLAGSAAIVLVAVLAGIVPSRSTSRPTEVAGNVLVPSSTTTSVAPATTAPATTVTTSINVQQRPQEVTLGYAAAVTQALDRSLGAAIRAMVASRGPNGDFYARLGALYAGSELARKQSVYAAEAGRNLDAFRDVPGDPVTAVDQVIRADPVCVVLAVTRDFAQMLDDPRDAPVKGFLALAPKRSGSDPRGYNPTAWSIVFDGATVDGLPPTSPC